MSAVRSGTVALVIVLLTTASAAAAPVGPLSGSAGCVAQSNSGGRHCAISRGLTGAQSLAISPDGAYVYAAAGVDTTNDDPGYGGVSTLKRDPSTGGLTEIGCISSDGTDGRDGATGACATSAGLLDADAIAVSPDGRNVYAAAFTSGSIVGFARDASTGRLTELSCFAELPPAGSPCYGARIFLGSDGIAVTPDNGAVYVGSIRRDAIGEVRASDAPPPSNGAPPPTSAAAVFESPPRGNYLSDPCIATAGHDGACDVGASTRGIEALAVSPDGKNVYATASRSGAVDVFTRDASGKLSETGCLMANAPNGACARARLLSTPGQMAMSSDGRNLYVVDAAKLVILRRDPTAGSLSEVGCVDELPAPPPSSGSGSGSGSGSASSARVHRAQSDPCTQVPGLDSISVVAASPDGSTVYVAGDGALAVFSRNASTGKLHETSCNAPSDDRCSPIASLTGVRDAKVSPDGRNLYLASSGDNGIFAFGQGATASSARARVRGRAARVSLVCPRAMRASCAGRLRLLRAGPVRRWPGGRAPRGLAVGVASASAPARFRLRPGEHRVYRVPLTPALVKALEHSHRLRVFAVSNPDPGGGGAVARLVVLSR